MKENTKAIFILSLFGCLFLFAFIRTRIVDNELTQTGKLTIARIDSIKRSPKLSTIYLSYYIKNKKYISSESNLHKKKTEKDIGKFYTIKYIPKNPKIVRGIYSKQITDTIAILNAGFSKKEITDKN